MTFYIIYATTKDGAYNGGWCWTQVQAFANYCEQLTGEDFNTIHYGNLSFNASKYDNSDSGERAFVKDAMEEIDQNEGLLGNDNVLISHNQYGFGYGGGQRTISTGSGDAVGHAVYAGEGNTTWEVELFVWHELAHTYGAKHSNGNHSLTSTGHIYDVTPMAAAYCHDASGDPSTWWSAVDSDPSDGTSPDYFCEAQPNFYYQDFVGSDSSDWDRQYRHTFDTLSSCSEYKVENWAEERAPL